MGDVFILGAGFSKAISNTMPLLGELSTKLQEELLTERKNELDSIFKFIPKDNFEKWLTYLSQNQPWLSEEENLRNRALFLEISRKIAAVLVQAQREFDKVWEELRNYRNVRFFIDRWQQDQAHVITLNYDTLVEKLAVDICDYKKGRFTYPLMLPPPSNREPGLSAEDFAETSVMGPTEPYRPDPFPLYKLHGSINWYYSGASSFYGETIYCSYSVPVRLAPQEAESVHDKIPLIIPPVLEKIPHFQHESIRALWRKAGEALRQSSRVFCLGYSLPDTDSTMQYFLRTNSPEGRVPLYVVNIDCKAGLRYQNLLGDCYNIDCTFVQQNAISSFILWFLEQAVADAGETSCSIGRDHSPTNPKCGRRML